jgi:hypothetical protein
MKKLRIALLILTSLLAFKIFPAEPVVFDFKSQEELARWKKRRTNLITPESKFFVERTPGARDGKALVVSCKKSSGVLMLSPKELDLQKTPVMKWRWRVVRPVVIKGDSEPDDQAAGIYIADGTTLRQFSVSYRWELLRSPGSEKIINYSGGAMTVNAVCMRDRNTPPGVWVEEERDVLADFQKAFKRSTKSYFAIGISGNSQYSKSNTRVEIDYIEFHPRHK